MSLIHDQHLEFVARGMPDFDYTATGLHWDGDTLLAGNHRLAYGPTRDLIVANALRWAAEVVTVGMLAHQSSLFGAILCALPHSEVLPMIRGCTTALAPAKQETR